MAETLSLRFPNEPDGPLALAHLHNSAGDFLAAIPEARRVLRLDSLSLLGKTPNCRACDAYIELINAYAGLDSLPAAEALWYLGISLRHQGRIRDALALVAQLRAAAPDDPLGKLAHSQVLFEAGRLREAAAGFDSVAHFRAPRGPMANRGSHARHLSWNHTHTAVALAAASDTTALHSLVDSVAAIAGYSSYGRDWRLADHLRGLGWLARGQPERAVQSFRSAIHSPTMGYTRTNLELARTLLTLGRAAEAIPVLQPALRGTIEASNYYVTRTELHELLARSFQLANQPESAAAHYRKVVAAWSQGDPRYKARADSARQRLAALRSH